MMMFFLYSHLSAQDAVYPYIFSVAARSHRML
jgi:hypothetical protein